MILMDSFNLSTLILVCAGKAGGPEETHTGTEEEALLGLFFSPLLLQGLQVSLITEYDIIVCLCVSDPSMM